MLFKDYFEAANVRVAKRGLFITRNSLKSHEGEKPTFPIWQYSCHNAKVVHAFEAEVLKSSGYEIENTCDTRLMPHRLTCPFPRFPPLEVCVRRPLCAPRHHHGAGVRKPLQKRTCAH